MPQIEVEAYAGVRYPERPLRVRWQGGWHRVRQIEQQRQEPDRRCFTVLLEPLPAGARGDIRLRLCYDYANDAWQAEALTGRGEDQHT